MSYIIAKSLIYISAFSFTANQLKMLMLLCKAFQLCVHDVVALNKYILTVNGRNLWFIIQDSGTLQSGRKVKPIQIATV